MTWQDVYRVSLYKEMTKVLDAYEPTRPWVVQAETVLSYASYLDPAVDDMHSDLLAADVDAWEGWSVAVLGGLTGLRCRLPLHLTPDSALSLSGACAWMIHRACVGDLETVRCFIAGAPPEACSTLHVIVDAFDRGEL